MQFRVIGYKLPPRSTLHVVEERLLPVLAYKRRNILVVNKDGKCGDMQLMYVPSGDGRTEGTVLPGMEDVSAARMYAFPQKK
jgi:hypothetical protein